MAKIAWTHEALHWLQEIYAYIAQDNPDAAYRTINGIRDKALLLAQHPELGYKYEAVSDRDVRILLYGHYRIAYLVKSSQQIDILGVFHAAMEIEQYLRG